MKILCVMVFIYVLDYFDGARASSWKCSREGIIVNGSHARLGRKYRTYQCDAGYVSNIPDLTKIKFKCGGDLKWKAIGVKMASNNGILYSDNITCHHSSEKVMCVEPQSTPNLKSDVVQYQLEIQSLVTTIRKPQYFSGDKIKFSCTDGYEVVATNDYYDYYTTENATVSEITCERSGLWNGLPVDQLSLIECTVIQCDAREYMNISNGNVTNYKDTFGYLEAMQLSCDEGFRSKGDMNSLLCLSSDSFTSSVFRCQPITCITPVNPVNGRVTIDGNTLGDKAYFHCNSGTKLIGQNEWTCQKDGFWDSDCVICDNEKSDCSPPCIPLGAEMISTDNTFFLSSTVEFTCSGGQDLVNSTIRTCMSNRAWSGQPIDCTGESRYDPFIGGAILSAMETISNKTNSTDVPQLQGRMIKVGDPLGVDVYFLIDVSKSIDEAKMESRKQFMTALLPKLGINNGTSGTRLAFYYFASETDKTMNQHYIETKELFENYKEAQAYINTGVNLTKIRKQTSEYNTHGDPTDVATLLKKEPFSAEIYSIMIGSSNAKNDKFKQAMKKMASDIEDEEHFFEIRDEQDLSNIINNMILNATVSHSKCGITDPLKTKLSNGSIPIYEHDAMRHAWPWMAQLVDDNDNHQCGGSLIGEQWILTAAHCLKSTSKVILRKLKRTESENVDVFQIKPEFKTKHPMYNEAVDQTYLYDIALIKLPTEVVIGRNLLSVCLPNKDDRKANFEPKEFGVVTGWGMSVLGGPLASSLKQMQMSIKKCEENTTVFDPNKMFCAGGKVGNKIIDTCTGDSGGPFVVRMKNDEDRYFQIGVVSNGIGCKRNDKNGIYTKITPEVLDWIIKETTSYATVSHSKCGITDPLKTKLSNGSIPIYEHDAMRHAWPWMAQLVDDNDNHQCGGSLIGEQWILTAAHCLKSTSKVILRKLKRTESENVDVFQIKPEFKTKHPMYNEAVDQTYLYDIALIKLPTEVVIGRNLLSVCLPNKGDFAYFEPKVFGVVTGWGSTEVGGPLASSLKQMQMSIKECKENATVFDPNTMFCAGDKVGNKIIDTCIGDSGGPFVVRMKNDEVRYIQIGVMSNGIGCKTNDRNGFYTKITPDILDWIKDVTAST